MATQDYTADGDEITPAPRTLTPMMGFKAFHSAAATLAGIETAHMIRKGQIPATGANAFQTFAELAA